MIYRRRIRRIHDAPGKTSLQVHRCIGGGWCVRRILARRSLRRFRTKAPAVRYAQAIRGSSSVYIHRADGIVQRTIG